MARLKRSTLFYYSLTDLPVTLSIFPAVVFIPKFYASDMGVPLAVAANIILAVRLFDLFSDPLMGYVSDRTHSRWGRRRPWIVASVPFMMVGIYMLYLPPAGAGGLHMLVWMAVVSLGTTLMLIPYYAWGAELSPDYNERSMITGARSMMGVVGNLLAQLAPLLALILFGVKGTAAVLEVVGITMLVLMPVCVFLTVTRVGESQDYVRSVMPVGEGIRLMLGNGPFKRLATAFLVSSTGLSITTPLYIFFIAFVLGAEELSIVMLTIFYLSNLSAVPFWVWLSTKIGKHRAYVGSFALIAVAHPFYLLLGQGDFWWMTPVTIATGFAAGGFAALPNSMKADVIDLDTLQSGENRAAAFFSIWSLIQKLPASFGPWIGLMGLALFGFDPAPDAINGPAELFWVSFLFALFPSLFYLVSGAIVWNYPITEARHKEMRQELEGARTGTLSS